MLSGIVLVLVALLVARRPFDKMHLFVLTENVTTEEHVAVVDWVRSRGLGEGSGTEGCGGMGGRSGADGWV
jgi:hypothetical protein